MVQSPAQFFGSPKTSALQSQISANARHSQSRNLLPMPAISRFPRASPRVFPPLLVAPFFFVVLPIQPLPRSIPPSRACSTTSATSHLSIVAAPGTPLSLHPGCGSPESIAQAPVHPAPDPLHLRRRLPSA